MGFGLWAEGASFCPRENCGRGGKEEPFLNLRQERLPVHGPSSPALRKQGLGFRVEGLGFRVQGLKPDPEA